MARWLLVDHTRDLWRGIRRWDSGNRAEARHRREAAIMAPAKRWAAIEELMPDASAIAREFLVRLGGTKDERFAVLFPGTPRSTVAMWLAGKRKMTPAAAEFVCAARVDDVGLAGDDLRQWLARRRSDG